MPVIGTASGVFLVWNVLLPRWSSGTFVPAWFFLAGCFMSFSPIAGTGVALASALIIGPSVALVLAKANRPGSAWLGVLVAFALLIPLLSNSSGSPGHLHEQLATWLHITPDQAWHLVVGVRKTIHFSAYGLAALAAYRWSAANGAPGLWRGIAFTLPLACFDEFRQHFAAGREGSPWDVALDMAGAVTFLFLAWLVDRRRSASDAA